ncbi:MAG: cobalamin biosynthesis protein CobD [Planctomycetes bacterium]|nr:cobalamin biosynthesis protein CobD [Planctomycetota bacterium]
MELSEHLIVIFLGILGDSLWGDPIYRLHPIRLLGDLITLLEKALFRLGLKGYGGGMIHFILVNATALGIWYGGHELLSQIHPVLPYVWDGFTAFSLLCFHDLILHGKRVCCSLNDLKQARYEVSMLVGRDTEKMDQAAVVRATIESLSENLVDGVLTPIWVLCLFGLPGLIVMKCISSLDSMIGYKNERYGKFGWTGARSDDVLHWLPARLSLPLISFCALCLRLHPFWTFKSAFKYRKMLHSPNSGWSEAACAGALGVRLAGPIYQKGVLVNEEYLGEDEWPADLNETHLNQALKLILLCGLVGVISGLALCPIRLFMPW